MKSIQLHNFANFIFNTDVKQAKKIFQSHIPEWQLIEIKKNINNLLKINKGQNRLAWLDLVSSLDENQLQILYKHIKETY